MCQGVPMRLTAAATPTPRQDGHVPVESTFTGPVVEDDVGDAVDDDTGCERTVLFEAPADVLQSLLE
jgi:hypothetical protein